MFNGAGASHPFFYFFQDSTFFFLFRFSIVFPVQVYTCVAILQACSMHQMFCKVSHSTLANRIIRFSFSTYLYQHLLFCPLSIVLSSISYFRGVSNSDPSGSTFLILKIFLNKLEEKKKTLPPMVINREKGTLFLVFSYIVEFIQNQISRRVCLPCQKATVIEKNKK